MHPHAMAWVGRFATDKNIHVLDIGGRNINGTPRGLFPNADYAILDIRPGPEVDIVADAATWTPGQRRWDLVLACELFEHTPNWQAICTTAHRALRGGGQFVVTAAAPGREPHSAIDGAALRPDEHYANIDPDDLRQALEDTGFVDIQVDVQPQVCDVRAVAIRKAKR